MELQKQYIEGETVETLYFGGGTPSLLEPDELDRIMEGLHAHFTIAPGAEITLEANPDDIEEGKLCSWQQAGINRLSIGIQSFFDEDLRWMNRAHGAGQALASLQLAKEQGYDNISADLIYGGPTLPDDRWRQNVEQALQLGIPHLSCYALTVEPRTALDKMIRGKTLTAIDPDAQARQFLLLLDWLEAAGYEQYEISNFSLPGRRSRHNSSYWQGLTYLGLGPSAHAYNGSSRQWNVANNSRYIDSLLAGELNFEKEELSQNTRLNEYIMISLRTSEGCDLQRIAQRFGEATAKELRAKAERYIREGKMKEINEAGLNGSATKKDSAGARLVLTREGKLLADGIAADLFF